MPCVDIASANSNPLNYLQEQEPDISLMDEQATLEYQQQVQRAKYGDATPDTEAHVQKYYIYGCPVDQNWMCQWGIDNGVPWALTDDDRRALRLGMEVKPLIDHRLSECARMASVRFLDKYRHQIPGIKTEMAWVKNESAAGGVSRSPCWSFPKFGDASIFLATSGLDTERTKALEKFREELCIMEQFGLRLKAAVASKDDVFVHEKELDSESNSKKLLDPPRFYHLFEDMNID